MNQQNRNYEVLQIVNLVVNNIDNQRIQRIREERNRVQRFVLEGFRNLVAYISQSKNKCSLKKFPYYICFIGILVFCWFWNFDVTYANEEYYEQLVFNMNQSIIETIDITFNSTNCSQTFGENYEPLFSYQWPGTIVGCDCSQSLSKRELKTISSEDFFKNYFFIGVQCNSTRLEKKCNTINEIEKRNFSFLNDGDSGKPFLLCAKRIQGISLRDNQTYCNLYDKKICGDNASFHYCLPNNQQCPVSEIGFIQKDISIEINNNQYEEDQKFIQITKDFWFYYKTTQNIMPISQIKINEDQSICLLNKLDNISKNRSDYYLMAIKRQFCEDLDHQFSKVYQLSEEQLYLANNQLYLQKQLPYYQIDQDVIWTLQTKPYIQISEQCQQSGAWDQLINENPVKKLEFFHNLQTIILLGIIFLLFVIHVCLKPKDAELKICLNIVIPCPNKGMLYIVSILITIGIILTQVVIYIEYLDLTNQIEKILNQNCFLVDVLSEKYFRESDLEMSAFIYFYSFAIFITTIFLIFYQCQTKFQICSNRLCRVLRCICPCLCCGQDCFIEQEDQNQSARVYHADTY